MGHNSTAILEHKKQPFLKAFLRTGKVAPATRSVRISRDAVYDWLRADPSFRRDFNSAKRVAFDKKTAALAESFDFFLSVVRPILPRELYPRVLAAISLTLANRRFKDGSNSTARTASRNKARLPSFDVHPELANSEDDGSRDLAQGKNESLT